MLAYLTQTLTRFIRKYGAFKLYDTKTWEKLHLPLVKDAFAATCKRFDSSDKDICDQVLVNLVTFILCLIITLS